MELSHQYRTSLLTALLLAGTVLNAGSVPERVGLVERIAATIDEDVITLTELNWFVRFRGFAVPDDPEGERQLQEAVLEQLINQSVVFRESEKTPFVKVTVDELDRYLSQYAGRFSGDEGLAAELLRLGFGVAELRELLRRQLAVNKFVELRFEPFVIVLPDEIQEYYEQTYSTDLQEQGQTPPPLELVEETIREILSVSKTTEQLESWLNSARRRYEIQLLLFRDPVFAPNLPPSLQQGIELLDDPFVSRPSGSPESGSPDRR